MALQQGGIKMGCVSNSKPQNPSKAELKTNDEKNKESTIPVMSHGNADASQLPLDKAESMQVKDMIKLSKQKLQSMVNIDSPKYSHGSNLINHIIEPSQPIDIIDDDIINDQKVAPFQGLDISLHFLISIRPSHQSPSAFPKEPTCSC